MKKILSIIVICLLPLLLIGCSEARSSPTQIEISKPFNYPVVIYEITGSALSASVTLVNREGGAEQYGKVHIPWTYKDKSFTGQYLYISAQNLGGSGTIKVAIYIDGKCYKASSSSGAYVIASASGYLNQ